MKPHAPSLTLQETQLGQRVGSGLLLRLPRLQGEINACLRFAHDQAEAMTKVDAVLFASALHAQAGSDPGFAKFLRSGPP